MLLVDFCANSLHIHLLHSLGLHPSEERVFDTEELGDMLGDGFLCGVTRVSQVVDVTGLSMVLQVPKSTSDVVDMDGVQLQRPVPQKLHLFVGVFVDSTNNHTGHNIVHTARTIHKARTDNNVVKPGDFREGFFDLGLVFGDNSPRLNLGVFLALFLLSRLVDSSIRNLNESLHLVLRSSLSALFGELKNTLLVVLSRLARLGLSSAVENVVKLSRFSKHLGKEAVFGEIHLLELHLVESGFLSRRQPGGHGERFVGGCDGGTQVVCDEVNN
mmetsp:Transcript_11884/g.18044  ORF Transcript_11884/g.18044 Transcript_11884/m.18044 type:complete len:272 (-) Transcript_11884:220-1035(-)